MQVNLLSFFLFLSFLSCQINGQQNPLPTTDNKIPTRRELAQQFRSTGSATIIYPSDNQQLVEKYKKSVQLIQQQSSDRFNIEAIPANELTEKEFQEKITILLGTIESNKWIKKIKEQLPFQWSKNALHFDQKEYSDTSLVIKLPFYPNPIQPKLPMLMVTGLTDDAIVHHLEELYQNDGRLFGWSSYGYELYQNQRRIIYGYFDDQTWAFNKKTHFDFSTSPDSIPSTPHFNFSKRTTLDEAQVALFRTKCEENVAKIRSFLNTEKNIPAIQYCLYGSAEEKGLMIGNTDHSNIDFLKQNVHTVLNEIYGDNFIGKENEVLLRAFLGKPKTLALEKGLAVFFTKNWQRKGFQYWAYKLFASGNNLPLADILSGKKGSSSRYLNDCLLGSFVDFLIQEFGKDVFLKNYLSYEFAESEIPSLEKKWHAFLNQYSFDISTKFDSKTPYLKGFNFAHEGYRIYNGYISKEATQSLDKMVDLGSNASCIVPYTFMRNPRKASQIPIANSAGGENDESIIHAARMSHKRGMSVVLKPQIWVGGGSWPGDIAMNSEEEWDLWFNEYYEWILHYAMMAEVHEIEVLCVGTEFAKATLQRPDDWRKLLKKIRAFYSGKLTYAANWGDEFEKITFWDEFDYIGLNCYYPLSKNQNASYKELQEGFELVVDKIERVYKKEKKPILFTEIGFRSIQAPWTEPHAEPNQQFNEKHQQLCYQIVFETIQGKPWCKGILWWKFPSYLSYRGRENSSFSPNQKVVEKTIKEWFLLDN